ncbi:MAG: hypothetical protein KKE94_04320 [Gammaproteobacteria bacterium]|nr:hypothetical protein [Gammaproteobacteria bacterium]
MKLKNLMVTGVVLTGSLTMVSSNVENNNQIDSIDETQLVCLWHPYCNIPDIYSPILEPKDDKPETQDTKDEKLA